MARLNTHPSATPQSSRSTTVDSLYRDPTPGSYLNGASTARGSSYSVMSPARSMTSDKENQVPESRDNTPQRVSKGRRAIASSASRLPTPTSGSSSGNGNKRRRTDNYSMAGSQVYQDEDDGIQVHEDETEESGDNAAPEEEEDEATRYYNPDQDPELRRTLRANIRNNQREMEDNRDELVKAGNNDLLHHLQKQDMFMKKVRQTADAALDSRVMVLASDLAGRKLKSSLHGNTGVGIDVDQFVSRCINFMRNGGPSEDERASSTRTRNRRQTEADEDEEDAGDGLDWALLGRLACFPCNKRPPVPGFLLGPLSVQKRARAAQSRRARSQRQPVGPVTRPQELRQEDIQQSENTNLTHRVKEVEKQLKDHINTSVEKFEAELDEYGDEEPDPDAVEAACQRHRIYQDHESEEPGVSLFDFAINPSSFGQTVENLFYISFLIREGCVRVSPDLNGLPLLIPCQPNTIEQQRERNVQKHQAVFSLDWPTWKKLINAFGIKSPLIPHRTPEETTISSGGWYN